MIEHVAYGGTGAVTGGLRHAGEDFADGGLVAGAEEFGIRGGQVGWGARPRSEARESGFWGASQGEESKAPERASKRRKEMSGLGNSRARSWAADCAKRDFGGAGEFDAAAGRWEGNTSEPRL